MDKDEKIRSLEAKVEELSKALSVATSELLWLRKKVFGKMSEKHLPIDPRQLTLFTEEEMDGTSADNSLAIKDAAEEEALVTKTITVKSKPARRDLDLAQLPVKEENIYPSESLRADGSFSDELYIEIGTEESKRIEKVPSSVYVLKTIRHKVMLKSDMKRNEEDRKIITPELPPVAIEKCMAGSSVLTDIVIGKFMYHLPFHRQIQQYKEAGIAISNSTIGGWYEATVERLKLLYDLLRRQILSSDYIQIDESVIPVIDNEKHKAKKGYEWCVRDGVSGDVMFYYDRGSRAHKVAASILAEYHGTIQCDGYEAYDQFESMGRISVCGCWAHARRKFVDALDEDKARASEAINMIALLYKVEKEAEEQCLTSDQISEKRIKEAYPVIKELEKWMEEAYRNVLPKSRLGKAIAYTYSLLPRLSRYVNDGRINIDNNLIENAIRPLALGRKNYLFCGNDASAYRAAIVYSLIASCKAADVDPRQWMEDVLAKISIYKKENKDLSELLPRNWKNLVPRK